MTTPAFAEATAKRISTLLMPGETVQYAARRHWLSYRRALSWAFLAGICFGLSLAMRQPGGPYFILFTGIEASSERVLSEYCGLFCAVMTLGSALKTAIINWTVIMAVTSRRIILRVGLIARDTTDLPLSKIDIVMVDQGILDRILGCGQVVVRTVGEATTNFAAVAEPTTFRNAIIGALENSGGNSGSGKSA